MGSVKSYQTNALFSFCETFTYLEGPIGEPAEMLTWGEWISCCIGCLGNSGKKNNQKQIYHETISNFFNRLHMGKVSSLPISPSIQCLYLYNRTQNFGVSCTGIPHSPWSTWQEMFSFPRGLFRVWFYFKEGIVKKENSCWPVNVGSGKIFVKLGGLGRRNYSSTRPLCWRHLQCCYCLKNRVEGVLLC